jgi:hypothetical protein
MTSSAATIKRTAYRLKPAKLNELINQLLDRRTKLKAAGMPTFDVDMELKAYGDAWVSVTAKGA